MKSNSCISSGKNSSSEKVKSKKLTVDKKKKKSHTKLSDVLESLQLKKGKPHGVKSAHADKHVHPTKLGTSTHTSMHANSVQPATEKNAEELAAKTVAVTVVAAAAAAAVDTAKKATFLDLYPWPFKKTFKGVIRHREWNGLVKSIQDAVDCESTHENENLQEEIAKLLDERDALLAKLAEMREFVLKRNREFEAHFN